MGIELSLEDLRDTLDSLGINLPAWVILVMGLWIFGQSTGLNLLFARWFKSLVERLKRLKHDDEDKTFIRIRSLFAKHLISEVERLNREADWNDFNYTELEAEIEVDPYRESARKGPFFIFLQLLTTTFKAILKQNNVQKEKSLVQAIGKSRARTFLIIGDPGSGKTVSLRHFFLDLAEKCAHSRDISEIIPIYLNLKRLTIQPDEVNADVIHNWIWNELRFGQDRTIHEFLDNHFRRILDQGNFFFMFDSFDEIPAVMDAHEEEMIVQSYAQAIDKFLHATHGCGGLIASRPYRAPKTLNAQKMTILPLSESRIKSALYKYLSQQRKLADQLWSELSRTRDDLLVIAQIPFYLSLLVGFSKDQRSLPDKQYDLFNHFVSIRLREDEDRLKEFGLTPIELINGASLLAYTMTNTPQLGLEADLNILW